MRQKEEGGTHGVTSKRAKSYGYKRIEFSSDAVKEVELSKRTTFKDVRNKLHMANNTLWQRLKEGRLMCHTNAIKSMLTERTS